MTIRYQANPPLTQNLTQLWGRLLNSNFTEETRALGLRLGARYDGTRSFQVRQRCFSVLLLRSASQCSVAQVGNLMCGLIVCYNFDWRISKRSSA